MNQHLAERYDERIYRLAAGIEPVDAARSARVTPPVYVAEESTLTEAQWRRLDDERGDPVSLWTHLDRHDTCRHVLLYRRGLYRAADPRVVVRMVEGSAGADPRRFVPRRLSIPLLDPDAADNVAAGFRVWRPSLFPGAAYPIHDTATAIRGRVERDGSPMRWARVVARHPDTDEVVGRAHGDDRGEFLLVLSPAAASQETRSTTLDVLVTVFGPASAPEPEDDVLSRLAAQVDPLWDLPLEELPPLEETDAVSKGEELPDDYSREDSRALEGLSLGRTVSVQDPFEVA